MNTIFLLTVLALSTNGVAMDTSATQNKETTIQSSSCPSGWSEENVESLIALAMSTSIIPIEQEIDKKTESAQKECSYCALLSRYGAEKVTFNNKQYWYLEKIDGGSYSLHPNPPKEPVRRLLLHVAPLVHKRLSNEREQDEFLKISRSLILDKRPGLNLDRIRFVQYNDHAESNIALYPFSDE